MDMSGPTPVNESEQNPPNARVLLPNQFKSTMKNAFNENTIWPVSAITPVINFLSKIAEKDSDDVFVS